MENELLEKVVNDQGDRAEQKGGYLDAAQSRTFIDYMYDVTVLGSQVRKEVIRGDVAELTKIGIGERLLRVATEAVDDGVNAGAAFSKVSLSTTKFRLDFEISTEALEDGREGGSLADHIARMMARQAGNDLEDYAINAANANTTDPGLGAFDGWSTRANAIGHVVDAGGSTLDRTVLSKMIKALPRKAKQNRSALKFFASSNAIQDLLDAEAQIALQANQTGTGEIISGPLGYNAPRMYGQAVQEVPLFSDERQGSYSGGRSAEAVHTEVWLTDPKNLIWAVKRELQLYSEFVPKKDSTEYTMFCRAGTAIEDGNALVVARNVLVN